MVHVPSMLACMTSAEMSVYSTPFEKAETLFQYSKTQIILLLLTSQACSSLTNSTRHSPSMTHAQLLSMSTLITIT